MSNEREGPTICPFCGDEQFYDLFEVFGDGAWMIETCCATYHEALQADLDYAMTLPPHRRLRFLKPLRNTLADWGFDVRNIVDEDGAARFDHGLEVGTVEWQTARRFVAQHHRHNKAPVGWKYGFGAYRKDTRELVAVVIVGRPVSRVLAEREWLEVTRLCTNPDLGERTFNASSMLYAAAAREAARRRVPRIVTYTLKDEESGASLKASGWTPEHVTEGGSWDTPSRRREDVAPTTPKIRWGKDLNVEPPLQLDLGFAAA